MKFLLVQFIIAALFHHGLSLTSIDDGNIQVHDKEMSETQLFKLQG